jgi:cytochrome c oxidase assembly protein subunit 15
MSFSDKKPMRFISNFEISRVVKAWMFIGLVMIFFQILLGGITRLTGSGLSITKWEIVVGSVPPLNQAQWEEVFDLYKMTPQYQKINQGMSLSEFKFIYFWEFIHRLWGRSMGLVFLIPFLIFWRKGMFSKSLFKDLIIVFILAAIVASFGWIMVASGLIDRPWVNAYKLTLHLSLAVLCFSYLLWSTFKVVQPIKIVIHNSLLKRLGIVIIVVVSIQIMLGGIMAGIKAGSYYPTWPDMNGEIIPDILFNKSVWLVENFVDYERSPFLPALVQVLHRFVAYSLIIIGLCYFLYAFFIKGSALFKLGNFMLITMLVIQVLLGIYTLLNCFGSAPLGLGVLHQGGAIILLSIVLFLVFQTAGKKI